MKVIQHPTISPLLTTFKQKDAAQKIIHQKTLYSAGMGFIPMPVLDIIGITSIQLWMIRDVARVYQIPFERHLVKSFIGSIAGNLGAYGLIKRIPLVGFVFGGSVVALGAATMTYTLGKIFMQHFDQGGTLLDFNPTASRAYFYKQYKANKQIVQQLHQKEVAMGNKEEAIDNEVFSLQTRNQQLEEEEKLHIELHEEAEQFIKELHLALKEQEITHLKEKKEYQEKIDALTKAQETLQAMVSLLNQQLEEQLKRRRFFFRRAIRL